METQHAGERRELCPPQVEVAVVSVIEGTMVAPFVVHEEGTIIIVPVRYATGSEVEGCRYLLAQGLPGGGNVTAPGVGGISLLSDETTACEYADTLLCQCLVSVLRLTVVVVYTADVAQHKTVTHGSPAASHLADIVQLGVAVLLVVRLSRIHPIGVRTMAHQSGVEVLPVHILRRLAPYVDRLHAIVPRITGGGYHAAKGLELLVSGCLGTKVAPNGDEQMCIVAVYVVNHLLVVAKVCLVEEIQ